LPWPAGEARDVASGRRISLEDVEGKILFRKELAARETMVLKISRR
jgi:hypothetical protein